MAEAWNRNNAGKLATLKSTAASALYWLLQQQLENHTRLRLCRKYLILEQLA